MHWGCQEGNGLQFHSFKEVAKARVSGSQDQPEPGAVFQPPQGGGGGGLEPDHWL